MYIRCSWRRGVFLLFPQNSIFFLNHSLLTTMHTNTNPQCTHTTRLLVYSSPPSGNAYIYIFKKYEVSAHRDSTTHRDPLNGLLNYSDKLFEPALAQARVIHSMCMRVREDLREFLSQRAHIPPQLPSPLSTIYAASIIYIIYMYTLRAAPHVSF